MPALQKNGAYSRKSERYELMASVDISQNHTRASFGRLIDISRDGVGLYADPPLLVGSVYLFSVEGLGTMSCKILHRTGYNRYGGVWKISDDRKRKLEAKVRELVAASPKRKKPSAV